MTQKGLVKIISALTDAVKVVTKIISATTNFISALADAAKGKAKIISATTNLISALAEIKKGTTKMKKGKAETQKLIP